MHCIGSDVHGIHSQQPILSEMVKKILSLTDEEYMLRFVRGNPVRSINGLDVEPLPIGELKTIRPKIDD